MLEIPFCTLDFPCPYLQGKSARNEYIFVKNASYSYNSNLVTHGYRRFGNYFQKPICAGCDECKSLRVDARNFKFSKSHRRVYKKNEKTTLSFSAPILDGEHLELFEIYHNYMSEKKGWPRQNITPEKYYEIYVEGYGNFGKEISYYDEFDRLICVDLIDIVEDGISSIYCYYDPYRSDLSLGKFSLLKQIEIAKKFNLRWIYLGYAVRECASLKYKFDYQPYQILSSYTDPHEPSLWE
ncbi:arginyltransferase [Campylobacter sp. VBCF_05 NA6]|uniref:arginyltransferase n=1 Tax=unclassified Campylobacter TaxID=2593542 RepID=UPI0022E9AC1D|nr:MULTISPECIES: arginyltransferase [unclassified Campylobacter]MDA3056979.1 arginyltransferase [Campylobacter sp. VBCF_04 NA7]MDA3058748.1 arginyltransferase [Campylobacter sp. VBCF_05 NA6]